jgi:hypothetical protein
MKQENKNQTGGKSFTDGVSTKGFAKEGDTIKTFLTGDTW